MRTAATWSKRNYGHSEEILTVDSVAVSARCSKPVIEPSVRKAARLPPRAQQATPSFSTGVPQMVEGG
jgi:hypothetical protein